MNEPTLVAEHNASASPQPNVDGLGEDMPIVILADEVAAYWFRQADELERLRRELQEREVERLAATELELDHEIEDELALARQTKRVANQIGRISGAVIVCCLPLVATIGWQYYTLPLAARPFHHLHTLFKPSGAVGLGLGVIALATMTINLAYLLRKWLVNRLGPEGLPRWLTLHVATGLLAPVTAFLHAGFLPTSALGVLAIGAMGVVVASGIVGRYMQSFIPKTLDGDAPKLEDVRRRLVIYKRRLVKLGVPSTQIEITIPSVKRKRLPNLILSVLRVTYGDRQSRREYRHLNEIVNARAAGIEDAATVAVLTRRLCREHQWLIRSGELRRIIGAWRFGHRWFAVVLIAAIAFHIAIACQHWQLFAPLGLRGKG